MYISEESSQTTVLSGRMDVMLCPSFSPEDTTSETISTSCSSDLESWVLQSNTWIFSTSLPQNEMR